MTPEKPQMSKFQTEKSCQVSFNVQRRSTHERLVSESSRPYMLALWHIICLYMYCYCAYLLIACLEEKT